MRDRLTTVTRRVTSTFGSFSAGQKAMTIFAVVALAVGGYFFSTWASKPTYAPLFSNLAPADASAIVDKLVADGVKYELSNGGQTIMVPQDKVYDLRIKMSGQGLPAQSTTGYALLDKQNLMTSEFMQQVEYQRALEGELAKTIKSISGVTAATVHLAIPKKDIFADDERRPTASVLVSTAGNRKLSADQVQAVVHLVASSVDGLDPSSVTVVGANGSVLSGSGVDSGSAGSDSRTRQTQAYEQRLGSSLQHMLDTVVGPGHAVVQVTADLDFDAVETKSQVYVPASPSAPPLQENKKSENYTGTGNNPNGPLGLNTPGANTTANGTYSNTQESRTNAVGMVTETRKSAPGAVKKMSVAVLLDSKVSGATNEAQLQELISSAVGLDDKRGDTIAVTSMPFDTKAAEANAHELNESKKAEKRQEMMSLYKTAAVAGAVLLLLIAAMISSRRRNKRLSKLLKAEVAQFEERERARHQLEAMQKAALEAQSRADEPAALEPAPETDPRQTERDARQAEIATLVEKQPEEVAQLLRSWLADRRG